MIEQSPQVVKMVLLLSLLSPSTICHKLVRQIHSNPHFLSRHLKIIIIHRNDETTYFDNIFLWTQILKFFSE